MLQLIKSFFKFFVPWPENQTKYAQRTKINDYKRMSFFFALILDAYGFRSEFFHYSQMYAKT